MKHKDYVKALEKQLEGYRYFNDEALDLLKVSLDLGIVHNELWTRAQKFRGREEYAELMEFVDKLYDAKKGYDSMYTKYNISTRALDELRLTATALGEIVMQYELEDLQGLKL
jgi:undecaprenyl pyrophosphate synthase